MPEVKIQRVVYLPSPEMQFHYFRERIYALLTSYDSDSAPSSVEDLLELYEVSKYLRCESANPWIAENNFDASAYAEDVKKKLIVAINSCSEDEFLEIYGKLDYRFHFALIGCIADFSLYSVFTQSVLENILTGSRHSLRGILKHKGIVDKYNGVLAAYMKTSEESAEIILDRYVNKRYQDDVTLSIPNALSSKDINSILARYLDSPKASWNYVNMIAKSRPVDKFNPSLVVKAKADKFIEEKNPFKTKGSSWPYTVQHSFGLTYDLKTKTIREEIDQSGNYTEYNVGVLANANSATVVHSLISTLQLTNGAGIIELTHKNGLQTEYDVLVSEGRDYYHLNIQSHNANINARMRFRVFSIAIKDLTGKSIEEHLSIFYNTYLKEQYKYTGHSLAFAKEDDAILVKIRSALPIIEGLLKDYALYSSNQAGDSSIANRYRLKSYDEVASPIRKKYVTIEKDDIVYAAISQLMFSDLSTLRDIKDYRESYQNFFQIILHENVKENQLDDFQKNAVAKLVDNGVLFYDDDTVIRIRNIEFLTILYDLFRNETCMYWRYPITARKMMDNLVNSGFLRFQPTLLTSQEADFFSYLLKNDKFTNGPALRNKYLHDQVVEKKNENSLDGEYNQILLIITLILFKIEDDLYIEKRIVESESKDEIVRRDIV